MIELIELKNIIRALIFNAKKPVTIPAIQAMFVLDEQPSVEICQRALTELTNEIDAVLELKETAMGYKYYSKPIYAQWILKFDGDLVKKLPQAWLEILAIIAYKQPISRKDIEFLRGGNSSFAIIQELQDLGWVKVVNSSKKNLLYATTYKFLQHFNLLSIQDLPVLEK